MKLELRNVEGLLRTSNFILLTSHLFPRPCRKICLRYFIQFQFSKHGNQLSAMIGPVIMNMKYDLI